jgi:hypothetical protein
MASRSTIRLSADFRLQLQVPHALGMAFAGPIDRCHIGAELRSLARNPTKTFIYLY